jgi:hypothetical protein
VTSIFDETILSRPEGLKEERFVLSRKNGKISLRVRSPLFEAYFREQSKGALTQTSNVWGVPLYNVKIDPQVDNDLSLCGVTFYRIRGLWQAINNGPPRLGPGGAPDILFNVSFLLAKGIEDGLVFNLKDQIPLSLIEGPDFVFANTMRRGLYQITKQFLMDYEATIVMQSDVRLGG